MFCTNTKELNEISSEIGGYSVPEGECDFLHTAYCILDKDMNISEACRCDIKRRAEHVYDGGQWDVTNAAYLLMKEHLGEEEMQMIDSGVAISNAFNPASNQ